MSTTPPPDTVFYALDIFFPEWRNGGLTVKGDAHYADGSAACTDPQFTTGFDLKLLDPDLGSVRFRQLAGGKAFNTLEGYIVDGQAFFTDHARTFDEILRIEPFTHTGSLATYGGDNWDAANRALADASDAIASADWQALNELLDSLISRGRPGICHHTLVLTPRP